MIASGATDASDIGIDATTNEGSASSTADSTIDATRAATIDVTTASTIDAVAAAASPFCTLAPHRFCDDFDEGPLAGRWSALSQTGGIVALDSTTSISRPNSLIVQFSPLSSPNVLDTGLSETLPMPRPPATIVWDFQFQAVSIDSTANNGAVIGALDSFDDARNRYGAQFTLYTQNNGLHLWFEEESGFADGTFKLVRHDLGGVLSVGAWIEIRLEVAFTQERTASARVYVADVLAIVTPLTVTVTGKTLQLRIGSTYESLPTHGWKLRYDNVTLDF